MTTREEAVRLLTQTFVACSHEHPWPAGDMLRAALKVPPNDVDAAIGEDLEPLVDALIARLGLTVAPPPSAVEVERERCARIVAEHKEYAESVHGNGRVDCGDLERMLADIREPGDAEQALARLHGTKVVGVDADAKDAEIARLRGELEGANAALASAHRVVCGDHHEGLSGARINGSEMCPWCLADRRESEVTEALAAEDELRALRDAAEVRLEEARKELAEVLEVIEDAAKRCGVDVGDGCSTEDPERRYLEVVQSMANAALRQPPPSPPRTSDTLDDYLRFVIHGEEHLIARAPDETVGALVQRVLVESRNTGRSVAEWEVRNASGAPLDHTAVVGSVTKTGDLLFTSLSIGVGGAQPPPSPSREEAVERLAVMLHTMIREAVSVALKTHYPTAVVEQLAGAIHGPESLHALAGETLRTLGLVAVPGKLRERLTIERAACAGRVAYEADEGDMSTSYGEACGALADAVLSQLGAKP